MKVILQLIIYFSLCCSSPAFAGEVQLLGHYSNQKVSDDSDPHILAGYSVHLYRDDKRIFGSIGIGIGSTEGAPGYMYDIELDPATSKLRFKAKYSEGQEFSKQIGPEGRESRVLLDFSGTLTRNAIVGTVVIKDGYNLREVGKKSHVVLKRTKFDYKPDSFEKWAEFSNRAPKW